METEDKSREQLITESKALRQRISELEALTEKSNQYSEGLLEGGKIFQAIFESARDVIFVKDRNLRYTLVNPTMKRMFEYLSSELTGLTDSDLFGEEVGAMIREEDLRVLSGESIDTEHTKPTQNSLSTFHVIKVPIRNSSGEIVGICGIVRDITSHKRIEEELRKVSFAVEQSPNATLILDKKGNFEYVNPEFTREMGYTIEEIRGKGIDLLNSDVHPPDFYKAIWDTIYAGNIWRGDICCRKKDGKYLWKLICITPIKNSRGEITHFVSCKVDDTERKRAEEALLKSEHSYRTLAENLPGIVYRVFIRENNRMQFFNDMVFPMTGYAPEELVSVGTCSIEPFIISDDRERTIREKKNAINGCKPFQIEYRFKRKEGGIRYFFERGRPVLGSDGKPSHIDGVIFDVTEHKKMEGELFKAQRLESLGLIAGGIAHDFNNFLTAVCGNIELAKIILPPEDEAYKILSEAEKASITAKGLTQQLLTFSRGGAPVKETMYINELLKDSATFAVRGSKVKCEFSIPDDLWPVEIDKGQIAQVINNLVINGVHAMPRGGSLAIRAENVMISDKDNFPLLEDGKYIRISIEDKGTGIPQEHLQKIFDPFFTTKDKGSGLGLSISYSIIKRHNGLITVKSEFDIGTTFHIYLPVSKGKAQSVEENVKENSSPQNGKILLMDDEDMVLEMTEKILNHIGFKVVSVRDGDRAVAEYMAAKESGESFDVVILDLTVPGGMGGREAISRLLDFDPGVKAIIMSAYYNDPVMANFKKYGLKGVITKPFNIAKMKDVLNEVMKGEG